MKVSQYIQTVVRIKSLNSCLVFKSIPFVRVVSFLILLAFGVTAMKAQLPAVGKRPATVPPGYLITPFGYFHPTCVNHLSKGDAVLKDEGMIRHANGSYDALPACVHPHYNAKGEASPGASVEGEPPAIGHSWIEDESIGTSNSSYGELTADWQVPMTPTSNDGQTLYFFPGMADYNYDVGIIQPVLGWNADYSGAWGIASWSYVNPGSGSTYESLPMAVNSGDRINGTIVSTCSAGTVTCGSWNIVTTDVTSGQSTTLSQTSNQQQTFNLAFGGVLEVYSVTRCGDYPPDAAVTFSNVALYDYNFSLISSPGWYFDNYYSSLTPQCNYGAQATEQQVVLSYGVSAPGFSLQGGTYCSIFGGIQHCHTVGYTVTITDGNASASIYYTMDGSTPTTSSTPYTGPVAIATNTTFNAIAVLGSSQSAVTTYLAIPSGGPE